MNRDDERINMSLDEIIKGKSSQENDERTSAHEDPDNENCDGLQSTEIPRNVTITNVNDLSPKITFHHSRRNGSRPYNNGRYGCRSFQHHNGRRHNSTFPQSRDYNNWNWKNNSNARFRPYNGWHNQRNFYQRNSFHRYPAHRSQENLQYPQECLTEAALSEFNRHFANGDRSRRSGSVFSNRSGRSFRSNFSLHSRQSQRSHRSNRSYRSEHSNRSFGSFRSIGSNRSFRSNRSFCSNRSNGSNRSFGPRRPFRNNRPYGPNRSFGFKATFQPYWSGRSWMNNRDFMPYRKHKNTLNQAIQENIKKIQETQSSSSKSILLSDDLNFTPQPSTTGIPLHQRFIALCDQPF